MDKQILFEDELDILALISSSSDSDEDVVRGGSRPGKAPNIERYRETGAQQLHRDYFCNNPVYDAHAFKRRFRLSPNLYARIRTSLLHDDNYFHLQKDATGKIGLSTDQKMTAALRMLAYGSSADSVDEYVRLAESTTLQCLEHFCRGIIRTFAAQYLRSPTEHDLKVVLRRNEARGCPGLIGSIDCCKWLWRNCPTAWQGQFVGKEGVPAITLEAIADDRMWIWHMFFGMPGSANDINVRQNSNLLDKIASGTYPIPLKYKIAGQERKIPYWFADGIYPRYPCFVLPESHSVNAKEAHFSSIQESIRKDVERAFGRLQNKWHILGRSSRLWGKGQMESVVKCCIILHNMSIDIDWEEQDEVSLTMTQVSDTTIEFGNVLDPMWATNAEAENVHVSPGTIAALCKTRSFMADVESHLETKRLLVDHLWSVRGAVGTQYAGVN